jgi:hypothetical protein
MSDNLLSNVRDEIAARLGADDVLGKLLIITERKGEIRATIEKQLSLLTPKVGNRGICIVVLSIEANPETLEAPGPLLEMNLAVRVLENPTFNNSGLEALNVARRIARILHQYEPQGLCSELLAAKPLIVGVADPIAPLAYDVSFTARESEFASGQVKVSRPLISATGDTAPATVTITCGTAGSVIYYSLDGTFPSPNGAGSTPYSAPFEVEQAARVRACAYAPDLIASDTAAIDLN